MKKFFGYIGEVLQAFFLLDFETVRLTFPKRVKRMLVATWLVFLCLPIFEALSVIHSPYWHLVYFMTIVPAGLAYVMYCGNILLALTWLQFQIVDVGAKSFNAILKELGALVQIGPETIDKIRARLNEIITNENSNFKAAIKSIIDLVAESIKLPPNIVLALDNRLTEIVTSINGKVQTLPRDIKKQATTELTRQFSWIREILWWLLFYGIVSWKWWWYDNMPAYGLAIIGIILSKLIIPEEKPSLVLPRWVKWLAVIGVAGLVYTWYGSKIPMDLAAVIDNKTLVLFTGLAVIPSLVIAAVHFGFQRTFSYAVALTAVAALAWTNHGQQDVPRYLRATHVGGIPKHYLQDGKGGAIEVESTLWFRTGENVFAPKTNWQTTAGELVDYNAKLLSLDSKAKKDPAGNLWIRVIGLDAEGHIQPETPFYVPLRGDYVDAIPAPGMPVEFNPNPSSFDPEAGRTRIEEHNTLRLIEFGKKKFSSEFQRTTWLGFPPVAEHYAEPLGVDFEIGNGFETTLASGQEYLGTDFYCDAALAEVPVKAAADGEIDGLTLNSYLSVTIHHAGGVWTHYGHLSKIASILQSGQLHSGKAVKQGEVIGYIARGQKFNAYGGKAYLYFVCLRKQGSGYIYPVDTDPILGRAEYPSIPQPAADDGMLVNQ